MKYYVELFFNWFKKFNICCWINNFDRVVVVYVDLKYIKVIENILEILLDRLVYEYWDDGDCIIVMLNVKFIGFKKYVLGMFFYKVFGEIIFYYDFNYCVRDIVEIIWKLIEVFLKVFL